MSDEAKRQISYQPTNGLSYDPSEAKYWDEDALDEEIERVFEVCHGCRMCFKYCDSFPILFSAIDNEHDGDVRKLTPLDTERVMDACFQCKLCEVQCPYTPRDGHEFQLDFPKLVHRYDAIRYRKHEQPHKLRLKVLEDPDRASAMARASFGMANVMNRVGIHRWFMEKLVGIDRRKLLPDFAQTTFESWAKGAGLMAKGVGGEVVLFQTCYVQGNEPQIGMDTVEVLEKNGVDVRCEKGLECCGMPAWEGGNLELLRKKAHANLNRLMPHVDAGAKVIVLNPTCSMMLRREYPELYHTPCHLRTQGVGFKGRDLLRKIPGVAPVTVMECCGHDGTHAMTVEGFEYSIRVGQKAFDEMNEADAEIWATDCPLAAIQFQQHAGVKPLHPMSILARAYREDGFDAPKALPSGETPEGDPK
ncbi:MAG: 4Fe-4S dicluster domain-containing protein [Deltaproteobacteria bacterium]|nr:4Fe-4S dicluster domain-containing protein [Deltaproteobacteria bacterium]